MSPSSGSPPAAPAPSGQEPSEWRYASIGMLLSFAGGFADAGSYVLAGRFTGHITGNIVVLAISLAKHDEGEAIACLVAVASFLAGTAAGVSWPRRPGLGQSRSLAVPLACELALLVAAAVATHALHAVGRNVFLSLVCLALGFQNGTLGKIGSVSFHTTYVTGMSTSLVTALLESGDQGAKRRWLSLVIAGFATGALGGGFAAFRGGVEGFMLLGAPVALALLLAATAPRGR